MKKLSTLTFLTIITISTLSQKLTLVTDSKKINTQIIAYSDDQLMTKSGNVSYLRIDSIYFEDENEKYNQLYQRLIDNEIPFVFTNYAIEIDPSARIQEESVDTSTNYANFILEDGSIKWQKVYDRPTMSADSIRSVIISAIKSVSVFSFEINPTDDIVVRMNEAIFEKNGDLFNGRFIIEIKEGRYRVTLIDVRRFFGSKTMTTGMILGVSNELKNQNVGTRLEDSYLNKKGNKFIAKAGLDYHNRLFINAFNFKYKPIKKDDDW